MGVKTLGVDRAPHAIVDAYAKYDGVEYRQYESTGNFKVEIPVGQSCRLPDPDGFERTDVMVTQDTVDVTFRPDED